MPGVEATAEATTAAIDNLKLLGANRAGLAQAYDYHVVWANEGKLTLKKIPHARRHGILRTTISIVTKEGTGIKNLIDLKGKKGFSRCTQ